MELNLNVLRNLISMQRDEIEKCVEGSGFLVKTVVGVGTFLLDNEGNIDLLSSKQRAVFDKFIKPLLDVPR